MGSNRNELPNDILYLFLKCFAANDLLFCNTNIKSYSRGIDLILAMLLKLQCFFLVFLPFFVRLWYYKIFFFTTSNDRKTFESTILKIFVNCIQWPSFLRSNIHIRSTTFLSTPCTSFLLKCTYLRLQMDELKSQKSRVRTYGISDLRRTWERKIVQRLSSDTLYPVDSYILKEESKVNTCFSLKNSQQFYMFQKKKEKRKKYRIEFFGHIYYTYICQKKKKLKHSWIDLFIKIIIKTFYRKKHKL